MHKLMDIILQTRRLAEQNSTVLLTAAGVSGTVATAVLTGRATLKSYWAYEDLVHQDISDGPVTKREIVAETWAFFIPPVAVGSLTIASIIAANRIGSKQAAALAAAYGISERAFSEYREKIVEKLGERREQSVRDEITQERISRNPQTSELIVMGSGDVLCFDDYTGRYFSSSMEKIRRAENRINYEVYHHMYASLTHLYDLLDLRPTAFSNDLGWNMDHLLEISYGHALTEDGRPCLVLHFRNPPIAEYSQTH